MSRDDLFLFSLTFITGVFIGAYIYVAAFKPVYEPEGIEGGEIEASDFSVIGQTYGGRHERGYIHPSFRLLSDGSYSYLQGGVGGEALEAIEGRISRTLITELKKQTNQSDLEYLSTRVSKDSCKNYIDGIDYKYTIVIDGETYRLDTCTTNLETDDSLSLVLQDIWASFRGESVDGSYERPSGFADWLADQLYRRLHNEN